jgi:hypothetical protein
VLADRVVSSLGSILAEAMANGRVARNVVREQASHNRRRAIGAGQQFARDGGLMTYQEDPLELAVQGASLHRPHTQGRQPGRPKYSLIINLTADRCRVSSRRPRRPVEQVASALFCE